MKLYLECYFISNSCNSYFALQDVLVRIYMYLQYTHYHTQFCVSQGCVKVMVFYQLIQQNYKLISYNIRIGILHYKAHVLVQVGAYVLQIYNVQFLILCNLPYYNMSYCITEPEHLCKSGPRFWCYIMYNFLTWCNSHYYRQSPCTCVSRGLPFSFNVELVKSFSHMYNWRIWVYNIVLDMISLDMYPLVLQ